MALSCYEGASQVLNPHPLVARQLASLHPLASSQTTAVVVGSSNCLLVVQAARELLPAGSVQNVQKARNDVSRAFVDLPAAVKEAAVERHHLRGRAGGEHTAAAAPSSSAAAATTRTPRTTEAATTATAEHSALYYRSIVPARRPKTRWRWPRWRCRG